MNNILEISKRANKNGRVPSRIAFLKIHEDEKETNKNGIHWKREYVEKEMDTAVGMPICAELLDNETPLGHGLTGYEVKENGINEPLFENSVVVGTCEKVAIETIKDQDGNDIEALVGDCVFYNQRYPKFVKWVRKNYVLGAVDTSIEIMGKEENDNKIIYAEGDQATSDFRTPSVFSFTGSCILGISPSDDNAVILEISQKKQSKEEKHKMSETIDMKEITSAIKETISEINSKESELNEKISEQNSVIAEKDAKISELNASVEQLQKVLEDTKTENETYWEQIEVLRKEIAKAKIAEKLGEVDEALSAFNEDEKEIAKEDIKQLKENINACKNVDELNEVVSEVNSIKSKICMNIVAKQKAAEKQASATAHTVETNSEKVEDIFSEVCESIEVTDEDEDVSIF